jgi:RHS repeat-associated protein
MGALPQVGSVRLVVNVSDGTIAQRIDYTAFGEVLSDTNPGFQPFAFAGGLYDSDTRLVRFGARDCDPSVGRWTAKDPILFAGGQANLYVYVGNDPVNFVDPEGEVATIAIGAGIGALAGAGAAWLRGADTQALVAGAIGGGVAGALAGTGLGLGFAGSIAQQGFAAGLGGLVGDFANLRPGMRAETISDVGGRFATRAIFGVVGGLIAGGIAPLSERRANDLIVGGACNMESDFVTE